jgi:hypothetical protein
MANAYMLIALIIASGSCQEPRLIIQKMASMELCQAAANLATKAGGQADCLRVASPNAGIAHAGGHHRRQGRSDSSAETEEVQQLNRAQLNDR